MAEVFIETPLAQAMRRLRHRAAQLDQRLNITAAPRQLASRLIDRARPSTRGHASAAERISSHQHQAFPGTLLQRSRRRRRAAAGSAGDSRIFSHASESIIGVDAE